MNSSDWDLIPDAVLVSIMYALSAVFTLAVLRRREALGKLPTVQ